MTLHHVEVGDGVPVLALHGFWIDHRVMTGCLEPIFARRDGFRRLYPDLPGMGASPAGDTLAGSDDVLAAVQSFVDEVIGDTPFLIVGQSYGGYLGRALARARTGQVLGLAMICPIGTEVAHAGRHLPEPQVLRADPLLMDTLDGPIATEFGESAVVQSAETLRRFRVEEQTGIDVADTAALDRIAGSYRLSVEPEDGPPFIRPALIITGRQDAVVGYIDQFALLPHYPRATFAVLDVAGHNLQIEQPALFEALISEWLDRVTTEHPPADLGSVGAALSSGDSG